VTNKEPADELEAGYAELAAIQAQDGSHRAIARRRRPSWSDDDWDPDEETQAILADSRAMAAIREAEDPNAEYVTLEVVEAIVEARKARGL
jgi:hypothetical protein